MQQTITARRLVTDIGVVEYPVLSIFKDGTIGSIGSDPVTLAAETSTLTTGLLDIHIHGAAGVDVMNASSDSMQIMQQFLARHGVSEYLPTTVTAPLDFTLRALERMAGLIEGSTESQGQSRPVGIHIEGPFLSHAKRGMHPANDLQTPSIELFEQLQTAARGHIRLMTIAPELEAPPPPRADAQFEACSALDLIRHARERGVCCSLGHTNATAAQTTAGINAGAVSATHTFNAMRALDRREPGALGIVLDDDRLFADLICDGVHVAPPAVRLWWKAKGPHRAILITDALSATGMPDGDYIVGSSGITVKSGRALVTEDLAHGKETLAGSLLTLDRAATNLREFTGASLEEAVRSASHNPAAMLGQSARTRLAPGSVGESRPLGRIRTSDSHISSRARTAGVTCEVRRISQWRFTAGLYASESVHARHETQVQAKGRTQRLIGRRSRLPPHCPTRPLRPVPCRPGTLKQILPRSSLLRLSYRHKSRQMDRSESVHVPGREKWRSLQN